VLWTDTRHARFYRRRTGLERLQEKVVMAAVVAATVAA
jgi:hypothetical protein